METRVQKNVFMRADRDITVGEEIGLMDRLKATGAEQLALIAN